MSASAQILTDIALVISNGPAAATTANAIAAAGPIVDYPGVCQLVEMKLESALNLATMLHTATHSGDTANKALLAGIVDALDGAGSPGTTLVTDVGTCITNGPGADTVATCIAAAGPIFDYVGSLYLLRTIFKECYALLTILMGTTDDSTDSANNTLLTDIRLALT